MDMGAPWCERDYIWSLRRLASAKIRPSAMDRSTNSDKLALRPMRSVLTVPVIVPRFVEKAPSSGADVICLDLEDSVPPAEKARARCWRQRPSLRCRAGLTPFVRVNGPHTGLMEDDLAGVVRLGLDGVIISKAPDAETINRIDGLWQISSASRASRPARSPSRR